MKRAILAVGSLYLGISAGGLFAAEEVQLSEAARDLVARTPGLHTLMQDGRLHAVYGRPIAHGVSAIDSAKRFQQTEWRVFGVPPTEMKPHSMLADRRHTQPIKYDRATGTYELTQVYFSQHKGNIPVFRSELRVLVRNEENFPAVMAKSTLRPLGNFQVPQGGVALNTQAAIDAALVFSPMLNAFTAPTAVIWAGFADVVAPAPVMAMQFEGSNKAQAIGWLFVADAQTGQILYEETLIHHVDVVGTVGGLATEGTGAEQCENESFLGMPYARVTLDGGNPSFVFADANGDFVYPNPGTTDVTVRSAMVGEFFEVTDLAGPLSDLDITTDPSVFVTFTHNPLNTELLRAQVNAYMQANIVRDHLLQFNPAFQPIDDELNFSIFVNLSGGICPGNAFYSSGDQSINFCRAGGQFPNTAWSSVIWHEYGHRIVNAAGSGQCQYGEGYSDCIGVIISDESGTGFGFFGAGTCDQPLRDADNNCQYSPTSCTTNCGGPCHNCGRLLSGSVWSTRNELLVTNPDTYRDILSGLVVDSVLLRSPGDSSVGPSIAVDFLMVDDDDDNIDNGTPHRTEICNGFEAHGLECPELALILFEFPNGLPEMVNPGETTTLLVNVLPFNGTPVPDSGSLVFSIQGGSFVTVPMTEIATNQYEATLPAAGCAETIEYYFTVESQAGGTVFNPTGAPGNTYSAFAATGINVIASFDFETSPGWTVSGTAGAGQWDLGVPVNCSRGDPPTDYDGSGQCWLTENDAGDCNSDVDGGTTTLTSAVLDLSGLADPFIEYARWYSNVVGDSPNADIFEVEISNNNGASWVDLETVGPSGAEVAGGWIVTSFRVSDFVTPSATTRIRFTASDLGAGSIVEAALDALSIFDPICDPIEQAPFVLAHPASQTVCETDAVTMAVQAGGSPPLTFQWMLDSVDVPGATTESYEIPSAGPSDVGSYTCEITNAFGFVVTDAAVLSVVTPADCDDTNSCSVDSCTAGACSNTVTIPSVVAEGGRSVAATPQGCADPVALRVTSPDYPCLIAYADADGFLTSTAVFQTPDAWATVHLRGADVVPESTYHIATELVGGAISEVTTATTWVWGDADNNGLANLADVQLVVLVFQGDTGIATEEATDLEPCVPNGVVNLADAQSSVMAFQGVPYSASCALPCD